MSLDLDRLPEAVIAFLAERHIATLSTQRPDGSLHVTPVGFGYDASGRTARIITFEGARKARNLEAEGGLGRAVLCQVDGGRWLTLEGRGRVVRDAAAVARAVEAYSARFGVPGEREGRIAIEVAVERIMGRG
ncbi:MAG: TIGR03618 family F420-dependent PPOX class oxidoreductase [Chloroflexi bacterium]|nr:TIGR03618 family F420-dependent PPOX class oxidoreductase [Chloroflexota bacterium]